MPTIYPKASPTEVLGLLVLLNGHGGSQDIARLAEDLDLEIDEILPSVDFAEALRLLEVQDGRVTLTDLGRKFLASNIRARKAILREQLSQTTLYRALLKALEEAPRRRLSEDELNQWLEFTPAPSDDQLQNVINWGRYAELIRYDAEEREVRMVRSRSSNRAGPAEPARPPEEGGGPPSVPIEGVPPSETPPPASPTPNRRTKGSPPSPNGEGGKASARGNT